MFILAAKLDYVYRSKDKQEEKTKTKDRISLTLILVTGIVFIFFSEKREDQMGRVLKHDRLKWQPIDTAPKEGSVLMYVPGVDPIQVHYSKSTETWVHCCLCVTEQAPTHWMPLPEPPEDDK